MKKIAAISASLVLGLTAFVAQAATYNVSPWTYDPGSTGTAVSYVSNGNLHLEKNAVTSTNSAGGAEITGVSGLSTTGLTLSYNVNGYCGAGAPRFNLYLSDGSTVFLGCTYGNDGSGHVTFTAGNTYGGVLFPTGKTITGIDIVMDEQGQTTISNIMINGTSVSLAPTNAQLKEQCKNGGYKNMTDGNGNSFKNQGACVSHFAKMMNDNQD